MAEEREPVGSLGEEAAKLVQALQEWARESGLDSGTAAADRLGGALHAVDEHLATGAAECRYCPVCRVVAAMRGTSPEVRAQLATAGGALLRAAAGMLATAAPDPERDAGSPVEKIDLDEGEWEDGD